MAKAGGVGGVATMFAVVPVGKISKAADVGSLAQKFSDAVYKAANLIDYQKVNSLIGETLNLNRAGNVTSSFTLTQDEVLFAAEKYLGKGYVQNGPNGYRSADGLKRFRMDQGSLDGAHPPRPGHVHFEIFESAEKTIPNSTNHVIVNNQ